MNDGEYVDMITTLKHDECGMKTRRDAILARRMPCTSSHCYCGSPRRLDCVWWRARDFRECDTTTNPDVIAQVLWSQSREQLAKVNVELPASMPGPVPRKRWHQREWVRRIGVGLVPASVITTIWLCVGFNPVPSAVCTFLMGAYVHYDNLLVPAERRFKARHMVARFVAIFAVTGLLGWMVW